MLFIHRSKVFLIIFLLSVVLNNAFAQTPGSTLEINLADHDEKPYYFGISIGGNLSRFHTQFHPRFLAYDSVLVAEPTNSGGISLGLSATARISDRFQARFNPQLFFMERNIYYKLAHPDGNNETEVIKKVESVTMSFPIQLKFQSDRIGNFRVYTLAGFRPISIWPVMRVPSVPKNWLK
jgi:hypothetical protein